MAIRSLQVTVLGPSEKEFYTIEQFLAICGIYRYEVTSVRNRAEAMESLARGDSDCYILGTEALESWFVNNSAISAGLLPVVALGKPTSQEMIQLDPKDLSLGQLLLAMRSAMKTRTGARAARPEPGLAMAFSS